MPDIKEKYLRDLGSEIVNEGVHLMQVSLFAKETMKLILQKNIGGYLPSCQENQQHIEDQRNVFPTSQDACKQLLAKFHPWNVSK